MNNSFSSWFSGIRGKLLTAAFLPLVGFGLLFGIAHNGLSSVGEILTQTNSMTLPNLIQVGEMRQARNKFFFGVLASVYANSPEERGRQLKSMRESYEEYFKAYEAYTQLPSPKEIAETDDAGDKAAPLFKKAMQDIITLVEKNTPESDKEAVALLNGEAYKQGAILRSMTSAAIEYFRKKSVEETKIADDKMASANTLMTMTTGGVGILVFAVLMYIANQLAKSVGSVADRLSTSTFQVSSAVVELNGAGNNLSQSSTASAASLEETVAALEELTSMVQMNSDNAKQAARLAESSRDAAEAGEKGIKNLITAMGDISTSSKKIEEIISVIDDIAFQTNLLALNASVEAARAGDQGKGFAVVAEAVRSLAQRSALSAKDISSLIKSSVDQIESGNEIANESGTALSNIVTSIKKVSDLNTEIATASGEQTTGIQQISKAMNQLDQSSQSNAASAEEIAATSGEISNLATTTKQLTLELTAVVVGRSAPAAPADEMESVVQLKRSRHAA